MRKVYYLSTCDTCKRIMNEVNMDGIEKQDIKTSPVTAKQLEHMYKMTGSYEALFSKVARKYRQLDLHEMDLGEADFKKYLLQDYTFLKRPVFIVEDKIFIGNSKKNVEALKEELK